ncbi:hypothetical protein [Rhodoplanes roseus]|uniref:TonB C-terminal domain-containing protein n=1 Tax=Rhodoplanes roseus TaxID=29409 RepID=A0A327L7F9_9BRAD|nr:hypothetical protein [Rhodoplanes roseus]RAI45853.1 hypothetical protein CH341_01755 [Rhodoplanes roseus]
MLRSLAILPLLAMSSSVALAQLTETPGPGGIPIAPGAPVQGYTPGGVGIGGGRIAPGPAARDVPMYRRGPGDVPVLITPEGSDDKRGSRRGAALRGDDCSRRSCLPDSLRVTIGSDDEPEDDRRGKKGAPPLDKKGETIDTISGLFAALRACWVPPPADQRKPGMEMTVRFGLKPTGALMGPPFVTYATKGASSDTRDLYRKAITDSLTGCDRLRFTDTFGKALAGKPLFVRYVDDRNDDDRKEGERKDGNGKPRDQIPERRRR